MLAVSSDEESDHRDNVLDKEPQSAFLCLVCEPSEEKAGDGLLKSTNLVLTVHAEVMEDIQQRRMEEQRGGELP